MSFLACIFWQPVVLKIWWHITTLEKLFSLLSRMLTYSPLEFNSTSWTNAPTYPPTQPHKHPSLLYPHIFGLDMAWQRFTSRLKPTAMNNLWTIWYEYVKSNPHYCTNWYLWYHKIFTAPHYCFPCAALCITPLWAGRRWWIRQIVSMTYVRIHVWYVYFTCHFAVIFVLPQIYLYCEVNSLFVSELKGAVIVIYDPAPKTVHVPIYINVNYCEWCTSHICDTNIRSNWETWHNERRIWSKYYGMVWWLKQSS